MRVVVVSNKFPPNVNGGAEIAAFACVQGLVEKGHEVLVITEKATGPASPEQPYELAFVDSISSTYSRRTNVAARSLGKLLFHVVDCLGDSRLHSVRDRIARFQPQVLHCNNLQGLGYRTLGLIADLKIPTLVTLHDYSLDCLNQARFLDGKPCGSSHLLCFWTGLLKKKYLAKIETLGVCAPSSFLLNHFREHLPSSTRFRAQWHLPLDLPSLPVATEKGRGERLTVGFVGRLTDSKGADMIIPIHSATKAWANLIVAGEGAYAPEIAAVSRVDTTLSYQGFLSRKGLAAFFQSIDVLIVPSQWDEIYSLVVREAMEFGVPCVASSKGALPELINSERGMLIPTRNIEDWRDGIKTLCHDRALVRRLSTNSKIYATNLTKEKSLSEYFAMLHMLAKPL
jgi:glycosyltransferase involved in cell wall biosynthesis